MAMDTELKEIQARLKDRYWRLNNLYWIQDKNGNRVRFRLNKFQETLYKRLWYLNVILKARQLGVTTFFCVLMVDNCVFNPNQSCGIIAHTLDDSQTIFTKKVRFVWENIALHLPAFKEAINSYIKLEADQGKRLRWDNGSGVRVATSMRSDTLQMLLVSEYGKICAKFPERAEEVQTGSLQTVKEGQLIAIESTAEGQSGHFFNISQKAESLQRRNKRLTIMDPRFFFFPWWQEPDYRLKDAVDLTGDDENYFAGVEKECGIKLDQTQKWWYVKKREMLETEGETENLLMQREYPSYPAEAFKVSVRGAYYTDQMNLAEKEGRIGFYPYDPVEPVNVSFDLGCGANDKMAVCYMQVKGKQRRFIDYDEYTGKPLYHAFEEIRKKKYVLHGLCILPHDVKNPDKKTARPLEETAQQLCNELGFELEVLPRPSSLIAEIDYVRSEFRTAVFHETKCQKLTRHARNYKKKWNDKTGNWDAWPVKNEAIHGMDSFRYMIRGIDLDEWHWRHTGPVMVQTSEELI